MAAEITEAVGDKVDILVNSAFHGGQHERFEDADLSKWHRPMDVNYFGTLQFTQAVLPALKAAAADCGDARIVNINTMSVQLLEESAGSYAGSKAALGAVTKTLARELGQYGIRVNSVHPGYIWGDSVKIYFEWQASERGEGATWEEVYDERAAETCLGYLPHSSEISGAVVFYASPLAKCVTGTALPVNAGHWVAPAVAGAGTDEEPQQGGDEQRHPHRHGHVEPEERDLPLLAVREGEQHREHQPHHGGDGPGSPLEPLTAVDLAVVVGAGRVVAGLVHREVLRSCERCWLRSGRAWRRRGRRTTPRSPRTSGRCRTGPSVARSCRCPRT